MDPSPPARRPRPRRSRLKKLVDFATFGLRALVLYHDDRWGLSSLASERYDYAAGEVQGRCLDVGCGRGNRFVTKYLAGNGRGIDVFRYEGLTDENLVEDMSHFPFEDASFETVTFLANLNHVPTSMRDVELAEAYRCLRPGGNIIVTMGNPVAEVLIHKLVWLSDRLFGTHVDVDSERGMEEEEQYYVLDREIRARLARAGFRRVRKKRFLTQWLLNHMLVGWKP